jgi:1-acyl-sn-glycerol-3-phosphate acyltransferase
VTIPPGAAFLLINITSVFYWIRGLLFFAVPLPFVRLLAPRLDRERLERICHVWAHAVLRGMGVRVISNEMPDNTSEPCIYVAPHVNLLDPIVLMTVLPPGYRAVELDRHFAWPLYGRILHHLEHLPLSHSSPSSTRESLRRTEACLRSGVSLVVLPEGHRTRTGRRGQFGNWIFRVAARMEVPVVPIAFHGAWERLRTDTGRITPGEWRVMFLPSLLANTPDRAGAADLRVRVERALDECDSQGT